MLDTLPYLETTEFPLITRRYMETLQVNLGYRCNQSCLHCHVNAGPHRTEMMDKNTLQLILPVMRAHSFATLDLTGGAPEMHEGFRELVRSATGAGFHVIDRCNLTILFEPGQQDLAEFLADAGVEIVASLPCYTLENVDQQRGKGVFDKSIAGLQKLNALGYAKPGTGLKLNLVYNPQGAQLPPNQQMLEAVYKRELRENFSIEFSNLLVLANMPVKRFGSTLLSKGGFDDYMELLKANYSADNLDQVMCRSMVSVDWQGHLYDCDFNQQLGLKLEGSTPTHLKHLLNKTLQGNVIRVADHCFGCTAGQGSSCSGAL
jgi:radical SAM/Cys-rich protein